MELTPQPHTFKSLRAQIDRMGEWLDRLHEKYGNEPPEILVDAAYEKLALAVAALNKISEW